MGRILVAVLFALLFASPAFGADDVMAGYYGNTVVTTGGNFEIHTHYRADHTFDFTGTMLFMSRSFRGTWTLDGKGELCRTFIGDVPPDTPNPVCSPIAPHRIGDSWMSKDNKRTLMLKAGIL